jgi:hypothetical protein
MIRLFERRIMGFVAIGRFKVADAAEALGVSHATISRRCKALGIDPRRARADYVRRMSKVAERIGRWLARCPSKYRISSAASSRIPRNTSSRTA